MSTYPDQQRLTWSSEISDRFENHHDHGPRFSRDVPTQLNELHNSILSAAKVLKQVHKDFTQLKQENEVLRQKLLLAADDKRVIQSSGGPNGSFTHVLPCCPDSSEEAESEKQGTQTSAAPTGAVTRVLPYYSHSTEEAVGEKRAMQSSTGPNGSLVNVLPCCHDSTQDIAAGAQQVKQSSKGPSAAFVDVLPQACDSMQEETSTRKTETDQDMIKTKTSLKPNAPESMQNKKSKGQFIRGETKTTEHEPNERPQRFSSVYERDLALREMIFDPQTMKEKMKKNIIKPEFNICRFYHKTGYAQMIARSSTFEHIKLAAILLNTIWIAIDTEHNEADVLLDAGVGFQIAEHCFCLYFVLELLIRLAAFQSKRDCLKSAWFVFDAFLVIVMAFEDWIMTIVLLASASGGQEESTHVGVIKNAAILRILRLLRLARLGRALKLIRQSPEVMIMVKALAASTRCVMWTCVLLACMIFFFGVCFTQLCKDTSLQQVYFPSLSGSLHTLMIAGLFPDLGEQSKAINDAHFFYWAVFVLYLMMTTITILNLLIGVLVEVAQSSAKVERDAMDVAYVKEVFVNSLSLGEVEDFQAIFICKAEFAHLLQEQEILKALSKVGIDVFGLIDLMDFIFMRGAMGFVDLLEVVLQLRSSADVTVRDVVEVRKFLTYELSKMKGELAQICINLDSRTPEEKNKQGKAWAREFTNLDSISAAPAHLNGLAQSSAETGTNWLRVVDM